MTLTLPTQLPQQVVLTPGPSHNKVQSTLILAWISERLGGYRAALGAAHRGFK